METRGRKKSVTEPPPPTRDPRDDDGSEDVNPFGGGNPLSKKETVLEHIIWDIGDEEEEYPFVKKYPSLKKNLSCLWKMNRVLFMTLIMTKKNRCRFNIRILKMSLMRKKDLLGKEEVVGKKTI
nr:hypothetical protein [Tanacetum cinerariifolium]